MVTIAGIVSEVLDARGISQQKLADAIEMNKSTLSLKLKNNTFTAEELMQIQDATKSNIGALYVMKYKSSQDNIFSYSNKIHVEVLSTFELKDTVFGDIPVFMRLKTPISTLHFFAGTYEVVNGEKEWTFLALEETPAGLNIVDVQGYRLLQMEAFSDNEIETPNNKTLEYVLNGLIGSFENPKEKYLELWDAYRKRFFEMNRTKY